ncbi:GntR family transcriptional regulator [Govanella unica]|uniref:GntR family transcriptional regulator n=1 Tax=Govanella unica TaxID=2975056 RepID=A0A9X3TZB8_9PROT|nr:GntR family transcriptional regulator [Govania unica]MDA5194197.1 GntR family transcriptional regulator [Govania unica]
MLQTQTEDRGSLTERIRLSLADDIATGRLSPGMVLDEARLAESYGASRTPVREAVRQLAAAGLVEIRPRKGIVVLPMTLETLSDMFEVTAEVEAICARLATNRMTSLERSKLNMLHDSSEQFLKTGDVAGYDAFNLEFHTAIYQATHNNFLVEQALQLRARLLPFRRTQLRTSGRLQQSQLEHGQILKAMARGNADEAAFAMREHMLNAGSALARFLTTQV